MSKNKKKGHVVTCHDSREEKDHTRRIWCWTRGTPHEKGIL